MKSKTKYFFNYLVVPPDRNLNNHLKMEISGLEPLTSALQGQRSTN